VALSSLRDAKTSNVALITSISLVVLFASWEGSVSTHTGGLGVPQTVTNSFERSNSHGDFSNTFAPCYGVFTM